MKILYFDICAILIMLIMTADLSLRKNRGTHTNRMLLALYLNVLITTVFDLWSEAYNIWFLASETDSTFRYILYYGYFLSRNLTPLLYQLYLCAVTDTWHILKKRRRLQLMLVVPYAVVCMLLFSNLFFHNIFYFDENLIYTRSYMFYGLHACALVYLISGIVFLITYRKVLPKDKLLALICFYPWNLFAILIQAFIPEYLIEMFLNTVSLFLISNIVQRQEDMLNPIVGIESHIAFSTDMRKAFCVRKPVRILLARLVNYQSLYTILGNDVCNDLMKKIAEHLRTSFHGTTGTIDYYYLENGLFAAVSESSDRNAFREDSLSFASFLKDEIRMGKLEVEMDACLTVLTCPGDFSDYEKLMSFVHTFSSFLPSGGNVTFLEDGNTDGSYGFHLRNDIDRIIGRAIENNNFEVYYQPIYSVREKRFKSAEALIRLFDDTYGYISPQLLIENAEKNGTIIQIGEFVLDSACRFMSECMKSGLPLDFIELNLSVKQCVQVDLKDKVIHYLNKYSLSPDRINLEITESAAITSQDIVEENMRSLCEYGVSFSLDDYGTGYSNLSRVILLPFRIIKIDRSMTVKVTDPRINAILRHTISLLREIGIEVVVEGVETEDILKQFEDLGADYIQGYYFSKPLPENDFIAFMRANGTL
ncbi:MAG: EAL domain-containing protein [Bullifex sp.]